MSSDRVTGAKGWNIAVFLTLRARPFSQERAYSHNLLRVLRLLRRILLTGNGRGECTGSEWIVQLIEGPRAAMVVRRLTTGDATWDLNQS